MRPSCKLFPFFIFFWLVFIPQVLLAQVNIDLAGQLSYNEDLNDIWGYNDNAGNEYALVGTIEGTSIVDVTDPGDPQELFFVNGPNSTWRDLKTYNNYAYVVTEGGGGLQIIDLTGLPDSITSTSYAGSGRDTLGTAHNIFIDQQGYAYVVGHEPPEVDTNKVEPVTNGSVILDLNQDPLEPPVVGVYNQNYVHDLYVRNDTMWTGDIFKGEFGVVDVTDKSNPQFITSKTTPNRFTHNTWLSNNGDVLYTTDEKPGSFIVSYDVSELSNISELDRYQANPGSNSIPHNVYVKNQYLVASYYKDGLRIIDANRPENLVETGYFDTSPLTGEGYSGCWGAYPYFPSGNIVASDIQEGLFVFKPQFKRACYLEGNIVGSNGLPLDDVNVEIMGTSRETQTDVGGEFTSGIEKSDPPTGVAYQTEQSPELIAFNQKRQGGIGVYYQLPDNPNLNASLMIANIYGQVLHKSSLKQRENKVRIPVSSSGLYIVKLQYKQKGLTRKVQISK